MTNEIKCQAMLIKVVLVLVFSSNLITVSAKSVNEEMLVDYVNPKIASHESRWFYVAPVSTNDGLINAGPVDSGLGGYKGGGNVVGTKGQGHLGIVLAKGFQLGALLIKPSCTSSGLSSDEIIGEDVQKPGYFQVRFKSVSGYVDYKATTTARNLKIAVNYQCQAGNYLHVVYGESLGESGELDGGKTIGQAESRNNILYGHTEFQPPYSKIKNRINFYISAIGGCKKLRDNGKIFIYKCNENKVDLDAALSFVDWRGAKNNYELEGQGRSFDAVYQQARREWDHLLSRVIIDSNRSEKVLFYSFLWNALRGKSIINDADGRVLLNGKVHLIDKKIYNTDSMWGANYNLVPLWALVYPEKLKDYVDGLLVLDSIYGMMPDGWMGAGPVQGMSTNSSATIVTASVNYNLINFTQRVKNAILKVTELEGVKGYSKHHVTDFYKYGYIPSDKYPYGAASSTIEYSRDSGCVAKLLNQNDSSQIKLTNASKGFEKIFDKNRRQIVPKDTNGEFVKDFNEMSGIYFNEGNSVQYAWSTPDLIGFMISEYGVDYVYKKLLSDINDASNSDFVKKGGNTAAYYSMRYNHGNQVSQIMPFSFHLLAKYGETSKYVTNILNKFYSSDLKNGIGHGADDDQGQLSAWYVLASLGVYDFYGGCEKMNSIFLIPPKYNGVKIKMKSGFLNINNYSTGKDFVVIIDGKSLLSPIVDLERVIYARNIVYK